MKLVNSLSDPLISIILPVSNAAQFLSTSLQSLREQNYLNLEIIAVDDFSTDTSLKLLKEGKKYDTRLKVYRNVKKYGLAITLNRALKRARGKFVVFMDPRDTMTRNKLQKQRDFLEANPKVVAVGTQCIYLSEEDKRIGKSNFPAVHESIVKRPLHGVSMLFEGIMINRFRIPKDLLRFPSSKQAFLYSDMACKLMQYGQLANLPEYLQFHRKHDIGIKSSSKHLFSLAKLWLNSRLQYDTKLPFKSFFSTALKASFS